MKAMILLLRADSLLCDRRTDRERCCYRSRASRGIYDHPRILAGETEPYAGAVNRTGEIGYLPQDPKEGDLDVLARDRVLSARGLDVLLTDLEKQQALMAEVADDDARDRAIRRYGRIEERFVALGGYGAESEAAGSARASACPNGCWRSTAHPVRRTAPPGGTGAHPVRRVGRRRGTSVRDHAAARRADQPPGRRFHRLAAGFPRAHSGGLVIISHNVELLADVVNRVWFLDAVRGEVDVYNMTLAEVPRRPGHRRAAPAPGTRERRTKATALRTQAAKLGAKATKAVAAQNMLRRADRMMAGLDDERVADKVARIRFPNPAAVRAHAAGGRRT